ncbi:MAG TPA: hypothetical protein VK615_16510, partial [Candidatus Binatia bacterium]|nr:hypothetical protein [Candidatus Binatia bacterium]
MTAKGKIVLTIIVLAVVGAAAWKWWPRLATKYTPASRQSAPASSSDGAGSSSAANAAELVETQTEAPKLAPAGTYQPKDNTLDIELSEYAGYAGLIAANGGLESNENSIFFKKHGFKVRIKLSEEESWSALNTGKMAASATTVDVLAIHGRQFQVLVPAQIG